MQSSGIVTGQKVMSTKLLRAKELRQQMTPAEKALWDRLRKSSLDGLHFRRQQVIAGFIVDFYCHSAGLVIEIDGPIHESQLEYDEERERIFSDRGLRVLRFSNQEVLESGNEVIMVIKEHASKPWPSLAEETGIAGKEREEI